MACDVSRYVNTRDQNSLAWQRVYEHNMGNAGFTVSSLIGLGGHLQ